MRTYHRSYAVTVGMVTLLSLSGCPAIPEARDAFRIDADVSPDGDILDDADVELIIPLQLDRIRDNTSELGGGGRVTLFGGGFEPGMRVYFGDLEATGVLALDDDEVNADVPAHPRGLVDVKIERRDGQVATLSDAFLFKSPMTIESVEPNESLLRGGQELVVRGTHFDAETRVLVGGRMLIEQELVDAETITGRIPSRLKDLPGLVDVVASDGFEQRVLPGAFMYRDELIIDWMTPINGPVSGETVVTLHGSGFSERSEVRVGGLRAETLWMGRSDVIMFRTPRGQAGIEGITLSDGNSLIAVDQAFLYRDPEQAQVTGPTHAWPTAIPTTGGAQLALTVLGLPLGAEISNTSVLLNGQEAQVVHVDVSTHSLVVQTPILAEGPVSIKVMSSASLWEVEGLVNAELIPEPQSLSPVRGDIAGGQEVTLLGQGFSDATRVRIGASIVVPEIIDSETMTITMPPNPPGRVDVVVYASGSTTRMHAAYRYESDEGPTLWAVQTEDGAVSGGRILRLHGEGFTGVEPTVTVGQSVVGDVEVLDDATILCRAPADATGSVIVTTEPGGTLAMAYERFNPRSGYGGTFGGPSREAVNVTVLDFIDFNPVEGAFVVLWDDMSTPFQGYTDEKGQLTLSDVGLSGPFTVTAGRTNFTTASVVDFDARNVTLLLIPLVASPPGEPDPTAPQPLDNGRLGGQVETQDKFMVPPPAECDPILEAGLIEAEDSLCQPCQSDADCGSEGQRCIDLGGQGTRCTTSCETDDDCPDAFVCVGVSGGAVQCIPGPGEKAYWCGTTVSDVFTAIGSPAGGFLEEGESYAVTTRPGDHAVICVGGFRDPRTSVFRPLLMGVRRHVFTLPGDFVGAQDVVLDIPLNRDITVRLDNPPMGANEPTQHRLDVFLDFGSDGVFPMPQSLEGVGLDGRYTLSGFPAELTGSLYDASYTFFAQATMPSRIDDGLTVQESHNANVLLTGITSPVDESVVSVTEGGLALSSSGMTEAVHRMDGVAGGWLWGASDDGKVVVYNGAYWAQQQTPHRTPLADVFVRSDTDVWAVGQGGVLVHFDGLIWSDVKVPDLLYTANWWAIDGAPEGWIWLVGDRGVWRTRGELWEEVSLGGLSPSVIKDLHAVGPELVWFVGRDGVIRRLGETGIEVHDQGGGDLYGLDGTDSDLWVVGQSGRTLHYNGADWFDYLPVTRQALRAVTSHEESVWAVGDAGSATYFDGEVWRALKPQENLDLKAIGADATGRIQAAGQRLMVIGPFLDIPRLDFPLADTPTLDLALEWTVDEVPEASHHYIWLTDMTGFPFWMIQADGDVSDVSLPDLSEVGIPAVWPGSGGIRLQRAYAPAFNINDFDFRDMSPSRWRSWTTSVFPVQW